MIVKIAFDPSPKFHVEFGGVERQFRVAVSSTASATSPVVHQRLSGGGGFLNLNFQLFPGFRILTNNYWSQAGGRYIFGQVPDLIVNPDGSLSPIKTSSTVTGYRIHTQEHVSIRLLRRHLRFPRPWVRQRGGVWLWRRCDGPGSNYATAISQNRTIQEGTVGFNQTFWKDDKYGALNLMGQYSYLTRNPW